MIGIDTKDFIDLACDRLQKVYNVDNFELKVFGTLRILINL